MRPFGRRPLYQGLEEYYPVVFIDCVHIKIHRKRSVESEQFYVALAVTEESTREVLYICNMPAESSTGWGEIFEALKDRGLKRIGLIASMSRFLCVNSMSSF